MDVILLCVMCYVGSDLCDELITRSEESYRVCVFVCVCVCVCDLEIKQIGSLGLSWNVVPQKEKSVGGVWEQYLSDYLDVRK
jgi:hypothetical protein